MSLKLAVEDLEYQYDNLQVLEDINFSLANGEFIGLIGPNGSGKSTLLKTINNTLMPERGRVYLGESELKRLDNRQVAQKMALVPQNRDLNFNFTVREVVTMGRTPYLNRFQGASRADYRVVDRALELTNTEQLADRAINQLSGGEKQRVILARSLAQEPEILLLDEPTASLDINYQLEIMDLLANLNSQEELTILTVLHDLNLAARYCQRLILLQAGEIYAVGQPSQIITSQTIKEVYGAEIVVNSDPVDNKPYIRLKSPQQRGGDYNS